MGIGFKRGGLISYFAVKVSAQTGGTAAGGGRYKKGKPVTVTLTAASSTGYKFIGWYDVDGVAVSTQNPYTFTAESDVMLTAKFIQFEVSIIGNGTVMYNNDGSVTVTKGATPSLYNWNGWEMNGSIVSTAASYTFTPASDCTLKTCYTSGSRSWGGRVKQCAFNLNDYRVNGVLPSTFVVTQAYMWWNQGYTINTVQRFSIASIPFAINAGNPIYVQQSGSGYILNAGTGNVIEISVTGYFIF